MIRFPGISEERGYTVIRIWLGPKRNIDGSINPAYRRTFGPYNNANIQRAKNHIIEVREAFKRGQAPPPEQEPLAVVRACDLYHKFHYVQKRGRSAESIRNIGYKLNIFREYWPKEAWHNLSHRKR